jgi:hypothetical protein
MSSNQAKFDELVYPYRKQKTVEQLQSIRSTKILFRTSKDAKWVQYNPMKCNKYVRFHFDASSGDMVMRVDDVPDTFTRVNQQQFLLDIVTMAKREAVTHQANMAEISHRVLKGLTIAINPDRPPRNFKDAMSRVDKQEWATAYDKEYQGFFERQAFKVVPAPPGVKIHDTLTRLEYKEDNGTFLKRMVRLCARRDQQVESVSFNSFHLYAPTLKSTEARLLAAIAAEHPCPILKTDTRQAFFYGECSPPSQKHVWHEAGRPTMAYSHVGMDGDTWIPCGK